MAEGLRRALGLPWRTHSVLLAPITGMFPLRDELLCRMAKFVLRCISSDNSIVNFVARHGVYFSRMHSPIGLNTQLCCKRYSLSLYRFSCINRELIGCSVFRDLSNGLLLVSFMNCYWPIVVWVIFHFCALQTLILLLITCVCCKLVACIFIF